MRSAVRLLLGARAGHGWPVTRLCSTYTYTVETEVWETRTYINYLIPEMWQEDGFTVLLLWIKMLQVSSIETASFFSFAEINIFTFEFYRRYFLLKQCFPIRSDFAPRGHLGIPGDNFGCHSCEGQRCYWYLLARSQGCYEHPNNTQKSSYVKTKAPPAQHE